jgi:hypothetical protein
LMCGLSAFLCIGHGIFLLIGFRLR